MTFIPRKVFLINEEVMISVKFPESAVQNIEVLVREIFANLVDIFLCAYLL